MNSCTPSQNDWELDVLAVGIRRGKAPHQGAVGCRAITPNVARCGPSSSLDSAAQSRPCSALAGWNGPDIFGNIASPSRWAFSCSLLGVLLNELAMLCVGCMFVRPLLCVSIPLWCDSGLSGTCIFCFLSTRTWYFRNNCFRTPVCQTGAIKLRLLCTSPLL